MLRIEVEREDDRRGIAEVVDLPGALACGQSRDEAVERSKMGLSPSRKRFRDRL
jgi:hypothetical protein